MQKKIMGASIAAVVAVAIAIAQQNQAPEGGITTLPVQGNVYMLQGGGPANVAVQIGDMGAVVVDTGDGKNTANLVAAIRKLTDKPIQYVINTSALAEHVAGNDDVRKAGVTITGANVAGNLTDATAGAQVIAHENVMNRMSAPTGKQAEYAFGFWPTVTFVSGQHELHFNGEPMETRFQPHAITDGDSIVVFRRSDVVATGEIFNTISYPHIDLDKGGSIQGELDALNNVIDIAIPKAQEEGGTYIIPGRGRICDEFDVVEFRDMLTIIRDRVQNGVKKNLTLAQIKTAGNTKDYDGRWSARQGAGSADVLIDTIYKSLTSKK
jgi:glyoxylase-like metal-dependent hydrolase (beta-lactamase superfamily II)